MVVLECRPSGRPAGCPQQARGWTALARLRSPPRTPLQPPAREVSSSSSALLHARHFDFEDERRVWWNPALRALCSVGHAWRHINAPLAALAHAAHPLIDARNNFANGDSEWIRTRAWVAGAATPDSFT